MEHVAIDLQAAPLSPRNYEFLSQWLGPPAAQKPAPVAGDLISIQASVRGGGLNNAGDHYLFLGLKDMVPGELPVNNRPLLEMLKVVTGNSSMRGYLGAWPEAGLLSMVGGTSDVPSDPAGYSRLRTGVWRRFIDPFTVLSFHREVLEQATPQLKIVPSASPVQIAVNVEDLMGTNLSAWINREGFERAAKMSAGNLRLFRTLNEQLRVPADKSLQVAESVLDARLLEPLGGQYKLVAEPGGVKRWASTVSGATMPAGYQFPAVYWIRGLTAQAWFDEGRLQLHGDLEIPINTANANKKRAAAR